MSDIGLCVAKDTTVTPASLAVIGSQWARWTFDPDFEHEQVAYCKNLRALGIKRFGTCDMDTYRKFGNPHAVDTWERTHEWLANTFSGYVDAVNPLNEPDGTGHESSSMAIWEVNAILRITRETWPSLTRIVGVGDITGQGPNYYSQIATQYLDGIDAHLYAKDGQALSDAIDWYLTMGKPLWLSEIGVSSDQVGEVEQARFLKDNLALVKNRSDVEACFWFCAHAYDGWGLWRPDGSTKLAHAEFQKIMHPPKPVPQFALGFLEMHQSNPRLTGQPLEMEIYPHPGLSQQWTTTGLFWWGSTNLGGDGMGFTGYDLSRYLWDGSQLRKVN